ncbi:MAG: hypothetical protein QXW70_02535 [Candidatus Anstonellales archaeon]
MSLNALGIVKTSFSLYIKNMPALVWATLTYLISVAVSNGAAISIVLIFFLIMAAFEVPSLIFTIVLTLAASSVLVALFYVLSALKCGYFQMCNIASRGGSASVLGFLEYSSRKALPAFLIEVVQLFVIILFLIPPLIVYFLSANKLISFFLFLAFLVFGVGASFIFSLALPSNIMDGTNTINSLKRSIKYVGKYPLRYGLVILINISITSIVSLVPFFGLLLVVFFALPLFVISLFVFYVEVRTL